MIEIKGLKKSFGKHDVLKGIDLTIQDKEVVVIIGPSGSGKSTILTSTIWNSRRLGKSSSTASA